MADRILKQNKIPGCEKLTRPEEIKALSKYLRNIREKLEENTDLPETNLEIPGKTTGQLHNIYTLPEGYEKLEPTNNINTLETERLDLEDPRNPKLSSYREGLEDTRSPRLSDFRENIEDHREQSLENFRDPLEDLREPKLSDTRDSLEDNREISLENTKETLEDQREQKLSDYKETIEDTRELSLSDYKDNLEDNRNLELGNYKDTLEDTKTPELSDYKDKLEDPREPKLSDTRDSLEDNREISLENTKETLEDQREQKLSDYKETIENTRELSLSDYKDNLEDNRNPELGNYKDTLEDTKTPELSDYKETLEDSRELNLHGSNEVLDFGDQKNTENLPDFRDTLVDEREPSLGNYKDTIQDSRETVLEDFRDNLSDNRSQELSDYRENLEDTREPSLSDYKDSIVDERNPKLSNYLGPFEGEINEPESLYDAVIGLDTNYYNEETGTPLTDGEARVDGEYDYGNINAHKNHIEKITDDREIELPDTVIKKDATYYPETGTFGTDGVARTDGDYDYIDNSIDYNNADPIIQLKAKNKFERHRVLVDRPENNEEDARIDGVFPNNEWNTDGSPGYYGSFDDVIPKLTDDREIELPDTVIKKETKYNPLTSTLATDGEARVDGEYDYIDNSLDYNNANPIIQQKAKQKFERHQKVVGGIEPGSFYDEETGTLATDGEARVDGDYKYIDIRGLSSLDLYNLVINILNEGDSSNLEIDSQAEWKKKLSSFISAYLNPGTNEKPISPRNAHRFENELFRSFKITEDNSEFDVVKKAALSGGSDGSARKNGIYDFIDNNLDKLYKEDSSGYSAALDKEKLRVDKHTSDQTQDVPPIERPEDTTELMVEYIRYAAEELVGRFFDIDGDRQRKFLLTEALWLLILTRRATEVSTGINRDRLPGRSGPAGTIIDEANSVYQNGISMTNLMNSAIRLFAKFLKDKPNPLNRPEVNWYGEIKKTTAFQEANSRSDYRKRSGKAGVLNNLWNNMLDAASNALENVVDLVKGYDRTYSFKENYLKGGGIQTTLKDLCDLQGNTPDSVEDLLDLFKRSSYITTPNKFGTIHEGQYSTQTLDSNIYWEIIMEPFVDDDLNGGYSYLPCFNEINVINIAAHGVNTSYNSWVPINSFELQKSKLTTKSVGLFDGEFSFPISSELTNEIRFSIVDDQYKSWRNYFQKCMDVAVYNSEPHNSSFYNSRFSGLITNNNSNLLNMFQDITSLGTPEKMSDYITAVDKSMICVAFYKNITFRIRIYIMTPQYSTIRRFDLLCVLKDFSEEYSGDVDAGGSDLNITFSIVGENPNGANKESIRQNYVGELWKSGYIEKEQPIAISPKPTPENIVIS